MRNKEQLHSVPLYIKITLKVDTLRFLLGVSISKTRRIKIFSWKKKRFLVGISISNSKKLIGRKVEGYSRPEKHYEPVQHN